MQTNDVVFVRLTILVVVDWGDNFLLASNFAIEFALFIQLFAKFVVELLVKCAPVAAINTIYLNMALVVKFERYAIDGRTVRALTLRKPVAIFYVFSIV